MHAYIEITPFDLIKYEVDKTTGYLRVDRPQRGSSQPPSLYGFVPRTCCSNRVSDLSPKAIRGDMDPIVVTSAVDGGAGTNALDWDTTATVASFRMANITL